MRRAQQLPKEDAACVAKSANYSTMANYERFLKGHIQGYVDAISGYTGLQIQNIKKETGAKPESLILDLLGKLQMAENILDSNIKCINKDILQRNEYSSRLYTLQQDIEVLRKEAAEKKQIVEEAKERSSLLENPYNNTTWWETWFPLGRPIRKENVPVLLSVSIFMLIFSLGVFLRMAGMELKLDSVTTSVNSVLKNVNPRKYQ